MTQWHLKPLEMRGNDGKFSLKSKFFTSASIFISICSIRWSVILYKILVFLQPFNSGVCELYTPQTRRHCQYVCTSPYLFRCEHKKKKKKLISHRLSNKILSPIENIDFIHDFFESKMCNKNSKE